LILIVLAVFLLFTLGVAGIFWCCVKLTLSPKSKVEDYHISDFNLPVEEVNFLSKDGTPLSGWFVRGERPAVIILAHGYGRSREELLPHADMLFRNGYSVFLFDFRNRGKSGGDIVTLGFEEPFDIEGAVEYLKGRLGVLGNLRIGVLGVSLGAVSAIIAASRTMDIHAVVAEAPFIELKRVMRNGARNHFGFFPFLPLLMTPLIWAFVEVAVLVLRRKTHSRDQRSIVTRSEIGKIAPRPVFLIFDKRDDIIPTKWGWDLFFAAGYPKRLWAIKNAEHARGIQACPQVYQNHVVEFFDRYIN